MFFPALPGPAGHGSKLTGNACRRRRNNSPLLATALLLTLSFTAVADVIPVASVVRFNTVCTNCHEGECSGRLSFQTGASTARGHMQRYLGPISEAETNNLFAMLRHTKEHCTQYPIAGAIPAGSQVAGAELAKWRNPREGGHFIPLGPLANGEHRLRIGISSTANGTLKITNSRFEPLAEESLCPQQQGHEIRFVSEGGPHYLTINGPVELHDLRLEALAR